MTRLVLRVTRLVLRVTRSVLRVTRLVLRVTRLVLRVISIKSDPNIIKSHIARNQLIYQPESETYNPD